MGQLGISFRIQSMRSTRSSACTMNIHSRLPVSATSVTNPNDLPAPVFAAAACEHRAGG